MKKDMKKLLTCVLLAGLALVSCKPTPSPTDSVAPTPTPTPTNPVEPSSPEASSPEISSPDVPSTPDVSTPPEVSSPEDSSTPDVSSPDDSSDPSSDPNELIPGEGEELLTYAVNVTEQFEAGTASADTTKGFVTLCSGTEVRNRTKTWTNPDDPADSREFNKSIKLGSSSSKVLLNIPGRGILSIWVQNGSSSAAMQHITLTGPDGTPQDIEYIGTDGGSPVVRIDIPVVEGEYSITRPSGTSDIFNLELKAIVEVAAESGFEIVSQGQVAFLEGEEFDYSKLTVNKVFGNGRTEDLDLEDTNFSVDASAYNKNIPGTYTIKLNYKEYEQLSYDVIVYDVHAIDLDFDAIEKLSTNSAAGNGVYFNHSVKEVYDLNEEFSTTGLNVTITGKNGEELKEFRVVDNLSYSGFDSSTAGEKVITVSYAYGSQTIEKTFKVHVVDTAPSKVNGVVQTKVDPSYEGAIGAVVEGYNMFTNIQQALDYIEGNANIDAADQKVIELAPGTYTEKLEITIPYLTIKGSNAETTVIEWDSLYGLVDAGGFSHTTDSTATVAIRDSAIGCTIEGVTVSNWYNSQARYTERNLEIERGLALLVQADQFVMKDGKLLGVQDTLELFTGRQYFENVFISGYTDFIFGTNNTTYFTDCQIHTVDTLKDDKGTAGYLTAFKGSNKGSGDYIQYGAIFDGCKFTADEGVTKGTTAIGRTWGAYAAVTIMNSELGDHISLDGYVSTENKNKRYISMNGIHPTDETVQFLEYNNTGAGALTEAVAGMKLLSAEEAANYADFGIIFGTTNGKVVYNNEWDPSSEEVQVDSNIYYHFDGKSSVTGTSYTYTQNINGTTGTFEGIAIDATKGKVTARTSDTQINAGAKLIFDVEAGTTVVVATYPNYHGYSLNGVETTSDNFAQHYSEATTVTLEANATMYLFSITIKPNQEAPEAATLDSLALSGQQVSFNVGDAFSYADLVVKASYSDSSLVTLTPEQYTVSWNGDINVAGKYLVTVTSGSVSEQYEVNYVEAGVDPTVIAENTSITFGSAGNYKSSVIDFSNIQIGDNGGNNSQIKNGYFVIKVKAGATVTINGYPSYTSYSVKINDGAESAEITETTHSIAVSEDSAITITPVSGNNYFYGIDIAYAAEEVVYDENITIDLTQCPNGYQGNAGVWEGIEIDATNGKFVSNGSGWMQFNTGTVLKLNVAEGAQVSVVTYTANSATVVVENGVATITAVANDYIKSITVSYAPEVVIYDEDITIDLTQCPDGYQGNAGVWEGIEIDATNGKFVSNGSGWMQFNTGTVLKLNVAEGAQVSVVTYTPNSATVVVENGVATITSVANDYIKSITVSYAPIVETTTVYYYNEAWTNANAYVWNVDPLVAWPGSAMTAVEGKTGWYSIEIEVADLTGYNIIFNNGSAQTPDIAIDPAKLYFYNNSSTACESFEEA